MKFFALMFTMMTFGFSAQAGVTYERTASCGSHSLRTSEQIALKNTSYETFAAACSLMQATKDVQAVCESDSYSWLRKTGAMKFVSSTVYDTNCDSTGGGDYSCKTR